MKDCYFKEIKKYPLLSRKEEVNLARRAERGNEEARKKLIESNLRLVPYIAYRYQGGGLDFDELICAGNDGLIHAVKKYDWRKGKLPTYAWHWIKSKIISSLKKNNEFNRNFSIHEKIKKSRKKLLKKIHREPTIEEISRDTKIDSDAIKMMMYETSKSSLSVEELSEIIERENILDERVNEFCEYMEIQQREDKKNTFLSQFESQFRDVICIDSPEKTYEKKEEKKKIYNALSKLDPRSREILLRSFGIGEYEVHSLEKIQDIMNISRERVRQIKENALRDVKDILTFHLV